MRTVTPLFRLVACLGIAAGAVACGRERSAVPPPARVSAAAPPGDSTRPLSRDSADRCRWEEPSPRAHSGEEHRRAYWDSVAMGRGVALLCELRDGGRVVRVVVRGDAYSIPRQVDV